ncbi:MAG TPA: hypothetical protein VGM32_24905 [Rhodopila sp.]
MPGFDIVIKNGLIFDGTWVPRYRGDIGIRGGLIAGVGRISECDGARVIEADGLHVSPGFIDPHTHYDAPLAGFAGRGVLSVGAPAEIVIYDYDNLQVLPSEIVHDLPGRGWRRVQRARGYRHVLMNGGVTIEKDGETNAYSGRLLRGGAGIFTGAAA